MGEDPVRRDFFVSYAGADLPWADWVVTELENAGYSTVSQARNFVAGSNFALEMHRATSRADRTLVVLSKAALQSAYVQQEWAARLASDPTGVKQAVVPVRVEPCEVTGLLGPITYIDLVGLDERAARRRLRDELDALVKGARRPAEAGSPWKRGRRFPTDLPPVWRMPFLPNPAFTDRELVLAELAPDGIGGGARVQAIIGLGGMGKTQLATEYAYRHRSRYEVVWCLRAESPATLVGDYAALAGAAELPEAAATEQGVVLAAARRWLETSGSWLLVFDNAPGPEDPLGAAPFEVVADLLPRGGQGQVLVTSRDAGWESMAEVVALDVMDVEDAVAFLGRRTGSTDRAAMERLTAALGRLPLALEQAGAYIRTAGISVAGYLQRLARSADLIAAGVPRGRAATVASTWQVSIERIRTESPGAAELLECLSFLAPEEVPRDLFGTPVQGPVDGLADDPIALDGAVMTLRRYSLVKAADDALTVHRLVQMVVRQHLDDGTARVLVGACLRLLRAQFPADAAEVATWGVCQRLLPHALAAAGHAERLGTAQPDAAWLFDQAASYLQARARYGEADAAIEAGLRSAAEAYGPDHPELGRMLARSGMIRRYLGDFAQAHTALERALEIQQAAFGADHPEVATTLASLGGVLRDSGELDGARSALERALAIQRADGGPETVEAAITLGNLARVLRYLGEVAEARAALEHVLEVLKKERGPGHPSVGVTLSNLGGVLLTMDKPAEAAAALEEALAIERAAYGEQHPWVAITLSNVGSARRALGKLTESRAAYEAALAILQAVFGDDHPEGALTLNNLGVVRRDLGDLPGARSALERALAIEQQAYGSDQPGIAITLANLGVVRRDLGDRAGARDALEQAQRILARRLAPDHPRIQVVRRHLASLG